jgi:uncharacterized membrane protein
MSIIFYIVITFVFIIGIAIYLFIKGKKLFKVVTSSIDEISNHFSRIEESKSSSEDKTGLEKPFSQITREHILRKIDKKNRQNEKQLEKEKLWKKWESQ